jgi:virginiamycin B lyase
MQAHPPFALTAFPVPTQDSYLISITPGRDGDLWFAEQGDFADVGGADGKIGRIQAFPPYAVTEFAVPSARPRPISVIMGPDNFLWFAEYCSPAQPNGTFGGANKIARMLPRPPYTITQFALPTPCAGPSSLAIGPDGNIWFVEIIANKIGRIEARPPYTITEYALPSGGNPIGITAGPDGNMWFTERPNSIGRLSPFRPDRLTLYPVLSQDSVLNAITTGPDRQLYFSEFLSNKLGRFSACDPRQMTEISLPPPVPPFGLDTPTRGPNALLAGRGDDMWFAEPNAGAIGRLNLRQLDAEQHRPGQFDGSGFDTDGCRHAGFGLLEGIFGD